jgi:demethoxyubiquinone hydroxylase (CLK1/Coq7/Cat5 family)
MVQEPQENNILFHITVEQAELIAKHYNKDIKQLEDYEIAELLDRLIDELA